MTVISHKLATELKAVYITGETAIYTAETKEWISEDMFLQHMLSVFKIGDLTGYHIDEVEAYGQWVKREIPNISIEITKTREIKFDNSVVY